MRANWQNICTFADDTCGYALLVLHEQTEPCATRAYHTTHYNTT